MPSCSVYLLEGGFPAAMPGVPRDTFSATFPFWGPYQLIDFALANYRPLAEAWTILSEARLRHLPSRLSAALPGGGDTIVTLPPEPPQALGQVLALLRSAEGSKVLLAPLSQVCLLDTGALAAAVRAQRGIGRLALAGAPTDIFIGERRSLAAAVKACLQRGAQGADLSESLFDHALGAAFDTIVDIPGALLFRSTLTQLHAGNLWLAQNFGASAASEALGRLRPGSGAGQTVVERSAEVRGSFLSPGCRVEGFVEGSILFPEVVVHKGAVVYNSVVMSGNRIGARAQLCRALLLPAGPETGPGTLNVGENASVGLKASSAANARYPQQIRDGLTVLGMGAEIPPGFTVGPGCLIEAGVPPQTLKSLGELRKGASVPCPTDR